MYCFPTFSFEIESKHKPSLAKDILLEAIKANPSYIVRNQSTQQCPIVFTLRRNSALCFNSFLPVVKIAFHEQDFGTKIVANFQLKTSVTIILYVFTAIAIAFEFALLNIFFKNELVSLLLMSLPLFLVLFAIIMSYGGLKLGSKPIKEFFVTTLARQNGQDSYLS